MMLNMSVPIVLQNTRLMFDDLDNDDAETGPLDDAFTVMMHILLTCKMF